MTSSPTTQPTAPADSTGAAPEAPRRAGLFALAAVAVVALLLRLPGVADGPGYTNRDELQYVPKAIHYGSGDLNPHFFQNPPLTSYLMFLAELAWYGVGRVSGQFASAADFKAQYLADGTPAFLAARLVVVTLGVATVFVAFGFARTAARAFGASTKWASAAGLLAAAGIAASPLHAVRSAMATNEIAVTLAYTSAAWAALTLALNGRARDAALAGALAGVSAATKYTGALAVIPVAVAAVVSPGSIRCRGKLLASAALATAAGFVAACPWVLLDHPTFRAHVANLFMQRDRFEDDAGWRRYLETAWSEGLGPVWFVASLLGVVALVYAAARGGRERRGTAAVVLAAIVPAALFLGTRSQMAYGRYLMPVFPACVVAAAVAATTVPGRRWRPVVAAMAAVAATLWLVVQIPRAAEHAREAARPETEEEMKDWMRHHLPDGALVVRDLHPPWLPPIELREQLREQVPVATRAALTPAYRLVTAYDYFKGPLNVVPGTDVRVDEFDRLADLGPTYVVVSDYGEHLWRQLPPGDHPGRRWHEAVRASLPLVHEVSTEGRRGPGMRLYEVRATRSR